MEETLCLMIFGLILVVVAVIICSCFFIQKTLIRVDLESNVLLRGVDNLNKLVDKHVVLLAIIGGFIVVVYTLVRKKSIVAWILVLLLLFVVYKLCDYFVSKWIDAVLSVKSQEISWHLASSIIGTILLLTAEYCLWQVNCNSRMLNFMVAGEEIVIYLLFIGSVFTMLTGEDKTLIKNSVKAKWYFIVAMFLLLWSILTIIVGAAMPFHCFEGLPYYENGNIWNFVRNIGNSAYFVIVTISTVGFGDITPNNWIAKLEVVLIIISGLVFLSAFVNAFISDNKTDDSVNKMEEKQ